MSNTSSDKTKNNDAVRIGLCGLGTVGGGVFSVMSRNLELIEQRAGVRLELAHIGARRDNPDCETSDYKVSRDIFDVARDPEVDVLVELIGGITVAKDLVCEALKNGKSVVTANKALIATHGNEILALAEKHGQSVFFEAAVAGGIPVIKALREGMAANQINSIAGIINGTGNFILTEMREKQRSFSDALADAQALGYAEADPTFDVEGIDAAQKLVILAALAFGLPLDSDSCFTEGISKLSVEDIQFSELLGYRVKHLGIAKRTGSSIEMRVHPTLVPESQLLASVSGVMNAVQVQGDAVGQTMYYGPGAGAEPTASAVIADIVDACACQLGQVVRSYAVGVNKNQLIASIDDVVTPWYLRIPVSNKAGVLSELTRVLSEQSISVQAMQQPESSGEEAQVVLTTNKVTQKALNAVLEKLANLDFVHGEIAAIRVELFE